jgi:hypothetical protein
MDAAKDIHKEMLTIWALPHRARIRSDNFLYYEGIIANKWL